MSKHRRVVVSRLLSWVLPIALIVVVQVGFSAVSCDIPAEIYVTGVSPGPVYPGDEITVNYNFLLTGPNFRYVHCWLSETDGGAAKMCDIWAGDGSCQWGSNWFTFTAPSTPGSYTWYVAAYSLASHSTSNCGGIYDDNESFTFVVESPCEHIQLRNVSVSPSIIRADSLFTVEFEFLGTGPQYEFEHIWISGTDVGAEDYCRYYNIPACQWYSDQFTIKAPSTPGTYTWTVTADNSGIGAASQCGHGIGDYESFTFVVEPDTQQQPSYDEVSIRNVSVSPTTVSPGGQLTVSYEYLGTGPTHSNEYRWISQTNGGGDIACDYGDEAAGQWHSDTFVLTAPSTTGTYTWYVAGFAGGATVYCGGAYDDNAPFTFSVGPSTSTTSPPPTTSSSSDWRDGFSGTRLGSEWWWVRENPSRWAYSSGKMRITSTPGGLYGDSNNATNLLLRDAPSGDFEIETYVEFEPRDDYQIAGLLIYESDENFMLLGRAYCDYCGGNKIFYDYEEDGEPQGTGHGLNTTQGDAAYLKIVKEGSTYTGYYSADGSSWTQVARYTGVGIRPIGVGIATTGSTVSNPPSAVFDYVELR